eukprot:168614_1
MWLRIIFVGAITAIIQISNVYGSNHTCTLQDRCYQQTITCNPQDSICNIECNGFYSCHQATINCGTVSQCNIICQHDSYACIKAIINCGTVGTCSLDVSNNTLSSGFVHDTYSTLRSG